ncbi:hypothetical protein [Pseudomonas nitroreducens]|uniref:Uncharacterized protein n=1 Tax=Pseudomonas nitroreducens TaxID=46680 RepID=A0A6G6IXS2_PSENT|nr:hypothetical protein [Pseudomonas nitroreducens]QIE88006.1 hypothetical protein G5B91_17685 [Pseudomonas nitroreducens]
MTTRPIVEDQAEDIEEFAARSIRAAVELAGRHGYRNPIFTNICGDLCVIRFRRQEKEVRHERAL